MYSQWETETGYSLNNPRPKSITQLCTLSDNGVYVALQQILVVVVSDSDSDTEFNTLLLSSDNQETITCSGIALTLE